MQQIVMVEVGQIETNERDSEVMALYLVAEQKYGVVIYLDGSIEVFEYEINVPDWRWRVGFTHLARGPFETIQSHYFDR